MNPIKIKYRTELMRLWILRVALLFSVFAFSGFNSQLPATLLKSVKTELVESDRHHRSLKTLSQKVFKAFFLCPSEVYVTNTSWALANFNQAIAIKYRVFRKKHLNYPLSTIKLPIKTPHTASDEGLSVSSIG